MYENNAFFICTFKHNNTFWHQARMYIKMLLECKKRLLFNSICCWDVEFRKRFFYDYHSSCSCVYKFGFLRFCYFYDCNKEFLLLYLICAALLCICVTCVMCIKVSKIRFSDERLKKNIGNIVKKMNRYILWFPKWN